jgi:hypothetical protein
MRNPAAAAPPGRRRQRHDRRPARGQRGSAARAPQQRGPGHRGSSAQSTRLSHGGSVSATRAPRLSQRHPGTAAQSTPPGHRGSVNATRAPRLSQRNPGAAAVRPSQRNPGTGAQSTQPGHRGSANLARATRQRGAIRGQRSNAGDATVGPACSGNVEAWDQEILRWPDQHQRRAYLRGW